MIIVQRNYLPQQSLLLHLIDSGLIVGTMIASACIRIPAENALKGSVEPGAPSLPELTARLPAPEDAAAVARLVRETRTLEANSTYAYLLLCTHFAPTSVLVESNGSLVGCALGYRIPNRPSTLFIWQIGVHPSSQRRGVALRLLNDLLRRPSLFDVKDFETSIAPSNEASRALFERWANAHDMPCQRIGVLERALFGTESNHEEENLYRIGPRANKL